MYNILCITTKSPKIPKTQTVTTRKLNEEKYMQIRTELEKINWTSLDDLNTNEAHNFFIRSLQKVIDEIAPKITIKIKNKRKYETNG